MFLLSLLTNKDSYNAQIIQCVNDTIFRKRFRVPGFGTGSGTLEPVPWNQFLRQITTQHSASCYMLKYIFMMTWIRPWEGENSIIFFVYIGTNCLQQGHMGNKRLLQQSPPFLN